VRLSFSDIMMSRHWAEEHKGDDDPLDVLAHKLLSFALKQHEDAAKFHLAEAEKVRAEMEEVESRFVISGETF
jgi:nucleoside-diphosphate-sugar epimerase